MNALYSRPFVGVLRVSWAEESEAGEGEDQAGPSRENESLSKLYLVQAGTLTWREFCTAFLN